MQTFKKPLNKDEEAYYLTKSRQGDLEARNLLVEYNLRLVAHIVKKYQSGNRNTEDLLPTTKARAVDWLHTLPGALKMSFSCDLDRNVKKPEKYLCTNPSEPTRKVMK